MRKKARKESAKKFTLVLEVVRFKPTFMRLIWLDCSPKLEVDLITSVKLKVRAIKLNSSPASSQNRYILIVDIQRK